MYMGKILFLQQFGLLNAAKSSSSLLAFCTFFINTAHFFFYLIFNIRNDNKFNEKATKQNLFMYFTVAQNEVQGV